MNELKGHEHVVDCIIFATEEACKVIKDSEYYKENMIGLDDVVTDNKPNNV
jgi:hypothetical protein